MICFKRDGPLARWEGDMKSSSFPYLNVNPESIQT